MAVCTSFRIVVSCNVGGYYYLGMCLGYGREEMQREFCLGSHIRIVHLNDEEGNERKA
jgi:hypothetical protein